MNDTAIQSPNTLEAPRRPNRAERRSKRNRLNNYGNPIGMGYHALNKLGEVIVSRGNGASGRGLRTVAKITTDDITKKQVKHYAFTRGSKEVTRKAEARR